MTTECESSSIIKQAIHKMEIDKGNGVFNYAAILRILRTQCECECDNLQGAA